MKGYFLEIKFKGHNGFKRVRHCIIEYVRELLPDDYFLMEVAINEAVNNAVKHGTINSKYQTVTLKLDIIKQKRLIIRIKDSGEGFNVEHLLYKLRNRDISDSSLMDESGRGVLLMLHAADLVKYNKKGNEVILVKRLNQVGNMAEV
ncbi:MAG: ATP-binding protein [Clostridia bacterium]|nr:ATP-binding protein [Clostridia bacterium]